MNRFITLIKDGYSDYQILIEEDASESVCWASIELQRILLKMTGVTVSIAYYMEEQPKIGMCKHHYIVIGNHRILNEIGVMVKWDKIGGEGYQITTFEDNIIIAGSDKRGAMYGVFSFLDKYMGVRWFTNDIEHIPIRNNVVLPGDIEEIYKPDLEYREISFWEGLVDGQWCAHNKSNGHFNRIAGFQGGKHSYYPFVHSFNDLVSPEKYFDAHPEYFSEVNGVRLKEHTQLCLSNEDVFEISLKQVRTWISKQPRATIISISQNDGFNQCTCEKCRAIDEYEESHSGSLIRFVNKIADAIAPEYPHISIDTLAYVYTRKPPKHTCPHKNVIIRLSDIECCFTHPISECKAVPYPYKVNGWTPKQHFSEDIRQWAKIHNRLYVWDYVTNFAHPLMPFPNFKVLQPNIKFFVENNVTGLFEQGALWCGGGASMAELKNYVLAKLMWNPDCDTELLIDEFMTGVFKNAAPLMRRYFDLVHKNINDVHLGIYDPEDDTYNNPSLEKEMNNKVALMKDEGIPLDQIESYVIKMKTFHLTIEKLKFLTRPMLDEANDLFNKMEKIADNENALRRIHRERLGLRYIELYLEKPDCAEYAKNVDEFFEDVKKHGILCICEGRSLEKSREMMQKGNMQLWDCMW